MSEAYLVTGCELPSGNPLLEVVKTVCASAGIKPQQIDEIHLYTDAATTLFQRKQDTEVGPIFTWPLLPLLPAVGLQSLCRALETGDLALCLLVEISGSGCSAILLANPIAVGRFNLSPLIHLANRLNLPDGMENLQTTALKTLAMAPIEIETENPVVDLRVPKPSPTQPWLALQSAETISELDWPTNRILQSPSLCSSLLSLAFAMNKSKTERGVWMSIANDGPVLSTLAMHL